MGLGGSIPFEVKDLSRLQNFDLSHNAIMGQIPAEVGQLSNLETLRLNDNRIDGEIPGTLGELTRLRILDLGENLLIGRVPHTLGALSQLEILRINSNQLNQALPPQLGELSSVRSIYLQENNLPGYIPAEISNATQLTILDLSQNALLGPIPGELGDLQNLASLKLHNNSLRGHIPAELPNASKLAVFQVNNNRLSGPLAKDFANLNLTMFWFNGNNLCEPQDAAFQQWLDGIQDLQRTNVLCPLVSDAKRIGTYNALNEKTLPGVIARVDDEPVVGDRDVDNAHDFATATLTYYVNTHGRLSYDDIGGMVISTVHFGRNYNNVYWNGEQMVYGDGYPVEDVAAHELTHGVTQESAALEYRWQSGALNESISDIFGAMVDRDDWLMGEDLPPDALGGREAIRSLANPELYGQPAHVDDWVQTCTDNEGVHVNSGIVSKAFYNIANVIGKGPTERIFYRALVYYLYSNSSLEDARSAALQSAQDLYGTGANYDSVDSGFRAVGLDGNWNPKSNECTCAASSAMNTAASSSANSVVGTLYDVRDDILSETPAGQHYSDLYYEHSGQISAILLLNPTLGIEGAGLLQSFAPGLASLVDGRATEERITPEQVESVLGFLTKLEAEAVKKGDLQLASDLDNERLHIQWEELPGMTFAEAWTKLNAEYLESDVFLPFVAQ